MAAYHSQQRIVAHGAELLFGWVCSQPPQLVAAVSLEQRPRVQVLAVARAHLQHLSRGGACDSMRGEAKRLRTAVRTEGGGLASPMSSLASGKSQSTQRMLDEMVFRYLASMISLHSK